MELKDNTKYILTYTPKSGMKKITAEYTLFDSQDKRKKLVKFDLIETHYKYNGDVDFVKKLERPFNWCAMERVTMIKLINSKGNNGPWFKGSWKLKSVEVV